jgi:hypothetical protein
VVRPWGRRPDRLFDINKTGASAFVFALSNPKQHGVTKTAQRTAALHPVGRIKDSDFIVLVPIGQARNQFARFISLEKAMDFLFFLRGQAPKTLAQRYDGCHILDAFLGQVPPLSIEGLFQDESDRFRGVAGTTVANGLIRKALFIAFDHLFEHPGGRHPRQIGSMDCGCEGQAQSDQIVGGIADYGLIEISDFDFHTAF